jgi:hypothetical protein
MTSLRIDPTIFRVYSIVRQPTMLPRAPPRSTNIVHVLIFEGSNDCQKFSFLHISQVHLASNPVGLGCFFRVDKVAGA